MKEEHIGVLLAPGSNSSSWGEVGENGASDILKYQGTPAG